MAGMSVLALSVVLFWSLSSVSAYGETYADKESMSELLLALQKRMSYQEERILALQDKHQELEKINDEQSKKIKELQDKNQAQDTVISRLQSIYMKNIKTFERNIGYLYKTYSKPFTNHSTSSLSSSQSNKSIPSELFRKERLLVPQTSTAPTQSAGSTVAFYAYRSQKLASPGSHIILAFDTVITNVGNSYHPHSGIFIAPRTGIYVFTWSFRIQNDAHLSTEAIVNEKAISAVFFDATNGVGGNTAATAVAQLNQNDEVFIRMTTSGNLGDILSDHIGRSYFGGWMLV